MTTAPPIVPPATIGMLGGGQLGRYALVAARSMGYRTVVLDPDAEAPAGRIADEHIVARYDDPAALDRMASTCAVVTTEFENPPASALERLARDVVVAPSPRAVGIAQDRTAEKSFLADHGFAVAPWAALGNEDDLPAARTIGAPAIVKTARMGYDGKGQIAAAIADDVEGAWRNLGAVPCVVERRLPLDVELSAIVARTSAGASVAYAIAENHHRDGILDVSVVPARIDDELAAEAAALGRAVAEALGYTGVLAIEMFVSAGRLLVNELAPRPHNSGHWTLDAALTDQFAQQIRAVTGSALGDPSATAPAAAMTNLLGDLWLTAGEATPVDPDWSVVLAEPTARLHLYGKHEPRPGRKMGHLTVIGDDAGAAVELAHNLRRRAGGH